MDNTDEKAADTYAASSAIYALTTIFVVTLLLVLGSLLIQGNAAAVLANPLQWFQSLDSSVSFDLVSTIAELLAALLAIAVTVVAIVVELAANRYSHRITSLFVREPINIVVLCFLVVATLYCIWISLTLSSDESSNAGLLISIVMATVSLIILLPYFAYVLSFLSPVNIISKIQNFAVRKVEEISKENIAQSKRNLLDSIDQLQDIARRSMELSDRAVEMASINSLHDLAIEYQGLVSKLGNNAEPWFEIDSTIKSDPDFISINNTSIQLIASQRLWVEVKIMRQYLDLISDSNASTRDTSYLIAINTKRIAIHSVQSRENMDLVFLCIRCFNSYLRATINNKDARTGYYIMNQYRMLAEQLLAQDKYDPVREISLYLQFYGLLGYSMGIPFLLEVAAEDVAELTVACIEKDPELLDYLIGLLLDLDHEVQDEDDEERLLGVRRAQLKLAAKLLECGETERADRICQDLSGETEERKRQLITILESEERGEYWEFTDRGVNFTYLPPELKKHLGALADKIQ